MYKLVTVLIEQEILNFFKDTQERFGKTDEQILLESLTLYRYALGKIPTHDCFWIKKDHEDILGQIVDKDPEGIIKISGIAGFSDMDAILNGLDNTNPNRFEETILKTKKEIFKLIICLLLIKIGTSILNLGKKISKTLGNK